MDHVRVGVALPGGTQFSDGNINPVWRAPVQTHSETVIAYVKPLEPRKLFVECVCAVLGRYLGLPIAEPLVVNVSPNQLPGFSATKDVLAFGSVDAGYPSFRRFVNSSDVTRLLNEADRIFDVSVFDEWVANWDRNIGNILYDGSNEFTFIDHENAIDPELTPNQPAIRNQLIEALYFGRSEFEKHKHDKVMQSDLMPKFQTAPIAIISERTYAGDYLDDSSIIAVLRFLETRVESIPSLFRKRIGLKQLDMSYEFSK